MNTISIDIETHPLKHFVRNYSAIIMQFGIKNRKQEYLQYNVSLTRHKSALCEIFSTHILMFPLNFT